MRESAIQVKSQDAIRRLNSHLIALEILESHGKLRGRSLNHRLNFGGVLRAAGTRQRFRVGRNIALELLRKVLKLRLGGLFINHGMRGCARAARILGADTASGDKKHGCR